MSQIENLMDSLSPAEAAVEMGPLLERMAQLLRKDGKPQSARMVVLAMKVLGRLVKAKGGA